MPKQLSERFDLAHGWIRGEDWWGDPVSANFVTLDMLVHPYVESMTETMPPAEPEDGQMWVVAVGAGDTWAGHDNDLTIKTPSGWAYCTPTRGVRIGCANPEGWFWFNGTAWVTEEQTGEFPSPALGTRYDVALSVGYEPDSNETLLVFTIPEAMRLPNGAYGSTGRIMANAGAIVHLPIRRNGADVGTISFSPSNPNAVIQVVGDKIFAAGDMLTVHAPPAVPDYFMNFGVTLRLLLQTSGG